MIKFIISLIFDGLLSWFTKRQKDKLESENAALKGRADSVGDSFAEQDNARRKAEAAKEEIKNQGNEEDVFGSEE